METRSSVKLGRGLGRKGAMPLGPGAQQEILGGPADVSQQKTALERKHFSFPFSVEGALLLIR